VHRSTSLGAQVSTSRRFLGQFHADGRVLLAVLGL
jgi:hypothetical protein